MLVVVGGVAPTKGHVLVRRGDEPMVGDGDAMSVTTQILEHILGAAEGWFGIDHPVLTEQWPQPGSEDLGLGEQCQISRKVKLIVLKGRPESGNELAAKDTTEHLDGEKEARAGLNPAGVIERDPTGRHDAVDMGMKPEFLVPGVQYAEETDLGPEMSGIAGDLKKSLGTGPEEQTIDDLFVLQSQGCQLWGQGKDHMDVAGGEKFAST
jgi:hypothetical protein